MSPVADPRETVFASVVVGSEREGPFLDALERRDWARLAALVDFDPFADAWVLRYAPSSGAMGAGELLLYLSPFDLGADDRREQAVRLSVVESDYVEGLLASRVDSSH